MFNEKIHFWIPIRIYNWKCYTFVSVICWYNLTFWMVNYNWLYNVSKQKEHTRNLLWTFDWRQWFSGSDGELKSNKLFQTLKKTEKVLHNLNFNICSSCVCIHVNFNSSKWCKLRFGNSINFWIRLRSTLNKYLLQTIDNHDEKTTSFRISKIKKGFTLLLLFHDRLSYFSNKLLGQWFLLLQHF